MDFGNVVLEHRPVVICQCKYDLCAICNTPRDEHITAEEFGTAASKEAHDFYQRLKVYGPRVVIHQDSHMGTCNDCGRLYKVEINEVTVTSQEPVNVN